MILLLCFYQIFCEKHFFLYGISVRATVKHYEKMYSYEISHDNYLFRVPPNEPQRKRWIDAIEKHQTFDYTCPSFDICCLHFEKSNFICKENTILLKNDAIPSIFNGVPSKRRRICEDCISLRLALFKAEGEIEKLRKQYEQKVTELNVSKQRLKELGSVMKNKEEQQNWIDRVLIVIIILIKIT